MKLQEAYAAEKNAVGTWPEIGYKGPGSNAAAGSSSVSSTFTYAGASAGAWVATATVALNDCQSGVWSVTTEYDSGSITTTADVKDGGNATNGANNCTAPLTPNFCKIATSGDCS